MLTPKNPELDHEELLLIGCGGHSKVVTDIAESQGYSNITYLNTFGHSDRFLGRRAVRKEPSGYNGSFFVAIGDNNTRQSITEDFLMKNPNAKLISLIHPSSVVSKNSLIGHGVAIMPLCVINHSTRIGDGVIVNTRSSIDHDSNLDDFSSVGPGVSMGGNVNIGKRSAISIGATVKHGVRIGKDVIVGASSLVLSDIEESCIAYGLPAKKIQPRKRGDKYL